MTPAALYAQNLISNGDFELVNEGAEPKATFPNWGEFTGDSSITTKNESGLAETISVLSGATSAELVAGGAGGAIRQNLSLAVMHYQIDLNFASLTPAAGAGAGDRFFSMMIKHGLPNSTDQINMRVVTSGQLQAFDGTAWQNIGGLTGLFTPDLGSLGAFDGETPIFNTLSITGDYDTTDGTPVVSYSITLNGLTATGLNFFQGAVGAAANNGLDAIAFSGALSAKNFVVDNVSVSAVPEPASTALMLGGGLLLSSLRRPRRKG